MKSTYAFPIIIAVIVMLALQYFNNEEKSVTNFIGIVIGVLVGVLISIPLVKMVFRYLGKRKD